MGINRPHCSRLSIQIHLQSILWLLLDFVRLVIELLPALNRLAHEVSRARNMRVSLMAQGEAEILGLDEDVTTANLDDSGPLRLADEFQNLVDLNTVVLPHFVDGKIAVPAKTYLSLTNASLR